MPGPSRDRTAAHACRPAPICWSVSQPGRAPTTGWHGRVDGAAGRVVRRGGGRSVLALARRAEGHGRDTAAAAPRRPGGHRPRRLAATAGQRGRGARGADPLFQPGRGDGRRHRPVPALTDRPGHRGLHRHRDLLLRRGRAVPARGVAGPDPGPCRSRRQPVTGRGGTLRRRPRQGAARPFPR